MATAGKPLPSIPEIDFSGSGLGSPERRTHLFPTGSLPPEGPSSSDRSLTVAVPRKDIRDKSSQPCYGRIKQHSLQSPLTRSYALF